MQASLSIPETETRQYENTKDGIMVADLSGIIYYANKSITKLTERRPEEFLNKSCILFQTDPNLNFIAIVKFLSLHSAYTEMIRCTKPDGTSTPLSVRFSFRYGENGNPTGVLMVFRKTGFETKQEESFFVKHRALLQAMNFRTDEICLIINVQHWGTTFCTDTIDKVLGWSAMDFISGGWTFAISTTHPEDTSRLTSYLHSEVEKRSDKASELDLVPMTFEYRKMHKNGSWKWMSYFSMALNRDSNGKLLHIITFMRDISFEKMKERLRHNPDIVNLVQNGFDHLNLNSIKPTSEIVKAKLIQLSAREKEILDCVKMGHSTKEIAVRLRLTVNTINTYRKNLMNKLHAKNTAELVKIAMEQAIT